ncbi:MAG TPA: DUF5691 domain-containing protein [Ktedonobacterales bacterium]|jgi:hypothetical protein|nr:DUF5691 domain-containing protein [Ktedonobacterales bacterium]
MPKSDAITTAALVGTARGVGQTATDTSVDTLPLPGASTERDLLLRAGALAVYRAAGYVPDAAPEMTPPAPEEMKPECSASVAALMESLLGARNSFLLGEALSRFNQLGYRLPHLLLPIALTQTPSECHPAMALAVGERGRWLGQFNRHWAWVGETLTDESDVAPPDAETIWEEGALGQRVEVLSRLRKIDRTKAREWVSAVWKREKVDARVAFLETFEVGLGAEDEEFLDIALGDKTERVREVAAKLLTSLQTSTLAGRMRSRAEAMLTLKNGALDAKPPTAVDTEWERDGLTEKVGQGTGQRTAWMTQVLERVPPSHWEAHFGMTPEELIAATAGSKWRVNIVETWTDAAGRFKEQAWAVPLWRFWLDLSPKELKQARGDRSELCGTLAPMLAASDLERFALEALSDPKKHDDFSLYEVLDLLPKPWSAPVADAWIAGVLSFIASITAQTKLAEPWDDTLETAALALPETHFVNNVEPLDMPDSKHWQINNFRTQLEEWQTTVRLRRRIAKELPL